MRSTISPTAHSPDFIASTMRRRAGSARASKRLICAFMYIHWHVYIGPLSTDPKAFALGRYWVAALATNPDLRFHVAAVCHGLESIVIAHQNQKGEKRVEVLTFRDGLVISSHRGRGYRF